MHVPILKQGDYLIATLQAVVNDTDLLDLRDKLAEQVGRLRSHGVIVDVTALEVRDSFAARTLRTLTQMLKLRGGEMVSVGISPEVALAMAQLGLTLAGVASALDLEEGLAYLEQQTRKRHLTGR